MIIFLDESGDLGFDFQKPGTSKKFVITLLVCEDQATAKQARKAVERTLKNKLRNHSKGRTVEEIKGSKTELGILQYFSRQMPERGWGVYAIALNKARVDQNLRTRDGKKKLYNYLARLVLEKVNLRAAAQDVRLVIDRSKKGEDIRDFNEYVANQLAGSLPFEALLKIQHEDSRADKGLQAVDVFSWGIYRKYEMRDYAWYKVFGRFIRYETEFLPEK